jgi:hypothetical protein
MEPSPQWTIDSGFCLGCINNKFQLLVTNSVRLARLLTNEIYGARILICAAQLRRARERSAVCADGRKRCPSNWQNLRPADNGLGMNGGIKRRERGQAGYRRDYRPVPPVLLFTITVRCAVAGLAGGRWRTPGRHAGAHRGGTC